MIFEIVTRKVGRVWVIYRDFGSKAIIERFVNRLRQGFSYGDPDRWIDSKTRADTEFDAKYGTDTAGIQEIFDLTIVGHNRKHGESHIATDPKDFADVMQSLSIDPSAYTFVDLGCGKGRVLILAAEYTFKKIVGVEFVRELFDSARTNITKLQLKNVELIFGDAATFEFPKGPVMLYLCNPFGSQIVREVAENARLSWIRDKRPLTVIYVNPLHAASFTNSAWTIVKSGNTWVQLNCSEET
jgi:SAM-dependent methyltransferase